LPWGLTVTYKLFDNGNGDTVADSEINTIDADGRPKTSTIRFNTNSIKYYIDYTPNDHSEFNMASSNAALGGGSVNNKRFGNATAAGGAAGRWDVLTLAYHEIEHSLGISNGQASGFSKFTDLVGAISATTDRKLPINKMLSGLTDNFDIPVVKNTSHFIGNPTNNDTFGFTVVADPGWQIAQRALPTCIDILAIAQTEGATMMNQVNCSAVSVPEPTTLAIAAVALAATAALRRKSPFSAPGSARG
jgi:hypothetical protein